MPNSDLSALLTGLHALAAAVWVGGMFFAHVILRPTLLDLDGPVRLRVWAGVFRRFFAWVWVAVGTLLATGFGLVFAVRGGFSATPLPVHVMTATGLAMTAILARIWWGPFAGFRQAVDGGDWAAAATCQATIRRLVLVNLVLGLATSAVGASGRYWT